MRGQLQAPAALPTDKTPLVSTDEGPGCVPQPVCTLKTISPASVADQRLLGGAACKPNSYRHPIAVTVYKGHELQARRSMLS